MLRSLSRFSQLVLYGNVWRLHERPRANAKVERGSTFTFMLHPPFIASILFTRVKLICISTLNSSLMMSLGAGALKVSVWWRGGGGGANAITRENVYMAMATLEVGTPPRAATNRHRHTEKIQWRYLPEKILMKQSSAQQGGRSTNPQWFARRQKLIRYDQQAKL